jgi:hypothetical protein
VRNVGVRLGVLAVDSDGKLLASGGVRFRIFRSLDCLGSRLERHFGCAFLLDRLIEAMRDRLPRWRMRVIVKLALRIDQNDGEALVYKQCHTYRLFFKRAAGETRLWGTLQFDFDRTHMKNKKPKYRRRMPGGAEVMG